MEKYNNLSDNYYFVVVGVKIYGAYGFQGIKLIKQEATGEKLSIFLSPTKYLDGNTTRQRFLRYGLPKINICSLRGPI